MRPAARVQAAIELLDEIVAAARGGGAAADTLIARYFKHAPLRRLGRPPRGARTGLPRDPPLGEAARLGPRRAARASPTRIPICSPRSMARRTAPPALRPTSRAPKRRPCLAGSSHASIPCSTMPNLPPCSNARRSTCGSTRCAAISRRGAGGVPRSRAVATVAGRAASCRRQRGREGARLGRRTGRGPGRGQPADRARLRREAGHAGRRSLRRGGRQDARARRGRWAIRAGSSRATPIAAGCQRLAPRAERAGATHHRNAACSIPAPRPPRSPIWRGRPTSCWSTRHARASGTWRRNPETRWRLDAGAARRAWSACRRHLLDIAAELVRPGGHLVYAVCSLLAEEGRGQAEAFASRRSAFVSESLGMTGGRPAGPGHLLTPAHDGTDGFFVARWRAPC